MSKTRETESESSDDEQTPAAVVAKKPSQPSIPAASSDDSEYETDSDDETTPAKTPLPTPSIKPQASSADNDEYETDSNEETDSDSESKNESAKRPAKDLEIEAKRQKTKDDSISVKKEAAVANDSVDGSKKKALFQRLWSDEDVIVVLEGMIEYEAKNKCNPMEDMDAFLDFVKNKLKLNANKKQLGSKIKVLKKHYKSNKSKGREFTKPHEVATYVLSEKIWGKEIGTPSTKANGKSRGKDASVIDENGKSEKKKVAKWTSSNGLDMEEKILRIGAELFEGDEEIEGSSEWKKLQIEDMKLSLRKLDVMRECMRLVLDKL